MFRFITDITRNITVSIIFLIFKKVSGDAVLRGVSMFQISVIASELTLAFE